MLIQKDFLNKLKDFGLNTYESKLWTALLSRGVSTAGELSDIANVPRSRCYDVLESLEKKGFIIMKVGKPIKYIAVPPSEVIDRVKKKIKQESEEQVNILKELEKSKILTELNILHDQGVELVEPTDLTGSLRGRDNLYNHLNMIFKNAKKSIKIVTTSSGLKRKKQHFQKVLKKASNNGINIKIISSVDDKDLNQIAEIKKINDINARFVIVDDKELVFMLLHDNDVHESYDTGIWVNSKFFAQTLSQMFDNSWKNK